jgi:uncharacterized protein (TIGR02145 family)
VTKSSYVKKLFLTSIFIGAVLLGIFISISGCRKENDHTVTDIDGNIYHTVTIGTQVWLVENLKLTHFRNGDPIPNVTDGTAWDNLTTGAYCSIDNNAVNAATYGHLYNWYAVNDSRNLCPKGWHVPTDDEWAILIEYLGGEDVAGGKLKEAGTVHWQSPNTGATNESGFTGLPGGCRRHDGPFHYFSYYGFWWTSTKIDSQYIWYRSQVYDNPGFFRNHYGRAYGCSVRCVRD